MSKLRMFRVQALLAGVLALTLAAGGVQAAPDGQQDGRGERQERGTPGGDRGTPRGDRVAPGGDRAAPGREHAVPGGNRAATGDGGGARVERVVPGDRHAAPRPGDPSRQLPPLRRGEPPRWFDGAHGHAHAYPTPGWRVRSLPPRSRVVIWGGVNYGFFDGIWYAPGSGGYIVARPPFGIVVSDLPSFRTVVLIGGIAYLYANGVYYREIAEGGYEVVPPPVAGDSITATSNTKVFIYPRQGQSAEQQASDEYECHAWAVTQSGFDPTSAATGQSSGSAEARRGDYQRARGACLEGRGYTVR